MNKEEGEEEEEEEREVTWRNTYTHSFTHCFQLRISQMGNRQKRNINSNCQLCSSLEIDFYIIDTTKWVNWIDLLQLPRDVFNKTNIIFHHWIINKKKKRKRNVLTIIQLDLPIAHRFILASSPPVTMTRPDFCPIAKHVTAEPWATKSSNIKIK